MLVMTLRIGKRIKIGSEVTVTVVEIDGLQTQGMGHLSTPQRRVTEAKFRAADIAAQ